MSSEAFDGYERQYWDLSASLSKAVASLDGEQSEIKSRLENAEVLIREMDLEAQSLPPNLKSSLLNKIRVFKSDLNNFKTEVKRITDTEPELHRRVMADQETSYSQCLFVETNLDTCLGLSVHKDEIIFDFKDKLVKQHQQAFPQIGDIIISAVKVKLQEKFYDLLDSVNVYSAFHGCDKWLMYIDAVKVASNGSTLTPVAEKKKKKRKTSSKYLEASLETEVVEKKISSHDEKRDEGNIPVTEMR